MQAPNSSVPAIDQLRDQVALVVATLQLRARAIAGDAGDGAAATTLKAASELSVRIADRIRSEPALPDQRLARALELSDTEQATLWLLAAIALDRTARQLTIADTTGAHDPTLQDLRELLYGAHALGAAFHELGPKGTLRRYGLIERTDGAGELAHETRQTWAITHRVLGWLHGDPSAAAASSRGTAVAAAELAIAPAIVARARQAMRAPRAVVIATGREGLGRRTLLATVARESGIDVLEVDARGFPRDEPSLRARIRAIALDCSLLGRTPLIANLDALSDRSADSGGDHVGLVGAELGSLHDGLILATCGHTGLHVRWDRPAITLELTAPSSAQLAAMWQRALGQGTDDDAAVLANLYPLAPALIARAAEAALLRALDRGVVPEDLAAGVRAVIDDRLGQLARRVTVTQTWDDLVLSQDQIGPIVELIARVRGRSRVYETWGFAAKVGKGLGVSALFSGPPGTGKTMVAALIAKDLGLELYQVDLGKVVSKYIGETEKHLGALFDAAEASHAVLLFDEADALFGKRTDVKSSNDRYANLETNYLLQRLETFTGICILTSNHESHLDPAFQRRLSLHLRFDVPDDGERAHLWRATFPASAELAPDLDFASLARRYAMSGGYIRNAGLRAAFLAADESSPITAAHLERAARIEYEGMGKIVGPTLLSSL